MIYILASTIRIFSQVLTFIIFVDVILSYFMDPYHPVRAALDRFVAPMLDPIRRIVPVMGMFDFSALILIILVQLISSLLISLLFML